MPKNGPLHSQHEAAGAKMADFSGWNMPLEYPGGGVIAEHTAVRERVAAFDVSHLGKAVVTGNGAREFVNSCLTNDLNRIEPGKAQYTLCCNESGGVVDDLIAYLRSDEEVFLIPNAANTAEVVRLLREAAPEGITVTDQHEEYAVLAVQGPLSDEVLDALGLPSGHSYMSFAAAQLNGVELTVCRTGYTGERGYELVTGWADAPVVWEALMAEISARGGLAAGLGARDTLRTEMGYALHGHELSPEITPVEGSVSWAVGWKKPSFWGRDALLAQREAKSGRRLVGLAATGRGVLRADLEVLRDGAVVGRTTSGTFSPTLKKGIALALVDRETVQVGDAVDASVRGRMIPCEVVKPPFVEDHVRS